MFRVNASIGYDATDMSRKAHNLGVLKTSPLFTLVMLAVLAQAGLAQPKIDARRVAVLEKKVASLQDEFDGKNAALRESYRKLQDAIKTSVESDQGVTVIADLRRALESTLKKHRAQTQKSGTAALRKAARSFKESLRPSLNKVENEVLAMTKSWLEVRINALVKEAGSLKSAMLLEDKEFAAKALQPLLDESQPFHERWNSLLAPHIGGSDSFRKSFAKLKKTKLELAVAKDPMLEFQIGAPKGFARVNPGTYVIRSTSGFNQGIRKKDRKISLDRTVYIGLYEVTIEEYYDWLTTLPADAQDQYQPRDAAGGYVWPLNDETNKRVPDPARLKHPVVGISLKGACAYALSKGARLPTEGEWCAAANGSEVRAYPWGAEYQPGFANDREGGKDDTVPVGSFENGRGPFGHYDLAGNVAEWLLTYENGRYCDPENIQNDNVVLRGGSFKDGKLDISNGWVWVRRALYDRNLTTGFRLAIDGK